MDELGAASLLNGKRIVVSFDKDRLDATMADLLKELVAFGIVEIRAAS